MGLVGGIIAAPCTGPMLAGLLAFIATTRSVGLGVTFMTTYALGMGVLFLLIATFALSLPKSGAWMDLVKAIGGIALLAVGFYFLRTIVPALQRLTSRSPLFLAAAIAGAVVGFALIRGAMKNHKVAYKAGGITLVTLASMATINFVLTPPRTLVWRVDQRGRARRSQGRRQARAPRLRRRLVRALQALRDRHPRRSRRSTKRSRAATCR